MNQLTEWIILFVAFSMIAFSAKQIGAYFVRFRLPLITGFLFAGMLAGPFVLNFISTDAIERLLFVEEASLAFIAFAAGSELYLKALRSSLKSIAGVTLGNTIALPLLGSGVVFLLSDYIPFMQGLPVPHRIGIALLAGAILMARSPSSAIAIVNELRAKGPFTRTTLGVTMVTDVLVIVIFAINLELADALLTGVGIGFEFVLLLVAELSVSVLLGFLLSRLLLLTLARRWGVYAKAAVFLVLGYGVFVLSTFLRHWTAEHFAFEFLLEPLLVNMIASFLVTNFSPFRDEWAHILEEISPAIYIVFFTITGASLALDVLAATWVVALMLFVVRLVGLFVGSFVGGTAVGDPPLHNRISWLTYVTQAGVGLGLAKEVAVLFPEFGGEFATEMVSVIVISQIIGPPLHKWAIHRVKEAHTKARPGEFDGVRDAIIFGFDPQALALARQLESHNWQVKIACTDLAYMPPLQETGIPVELVGQFSPEHLRAAGLQNADALVCLLSDEENYQICETVYEHFGTKTMVVRLNERANLEKFHALGVLIVEPGTAIVSLLDHFVRSPSAASLLLGMAEDQDVVELEVRDAHLHGVTLRDLRLPLDTLILSLSRNGHTIITHGYTQLELGDKVTIVGSPASLEKVVLQFSGDRPQAIRR